MRFQHVAGLVELKASHNYLNSLPDSVGQLSRRRELHLRDNRLARHNRLAALPETLGMLLELPHIDLRSNPLTCLSAGFAAPPLIDRIAEPMGFETSWIRHEAKTAECAISPRGK
jgi:hypothetical protein